MLAYVFVQLIKCDDRTLYNELKDMPSVKDINILFGDWDLIAKVEFSDPEGLANFILENVRCRPDVKETSTLIVAK